MRTNLVAGVPAILVQQDKRKIVPLSVGLFFSVYVKAVSPCGLEYIDAARFHHRSNISSVFILRLRLARSLCCSRRSGCFLAKRKGYDSKGFIQTHMIRFILKL